MKEYKKEESIDDISSLSEKGFEKEEEEVRKKALLRLTTLCVQGEHCEKDILAKMEKWGLGKEMQASIMEYLVKERFVDNERYCRAFVSDKMRYNHWGQRKIEQALWLKGIEKSVSSQVFAEIDTEEWVEILSSELSKKRKTVKGRNDYEIKQKLVRFAAGRGFPYGIISKCIDVDF